MSVPVLQVLDQAAFTRLGRETMGTLWETSQDGYEAEWLGPASPQRERGEIALLGWPGGGEDPALRARVAIWIPAAGEALFLLYARDARMGASLAQEFLAQVKAWCRGRGIAGIAGPMQFSTWHPYRFISRMGDAPFFPGEQRMPDAWHDDWLGAGFAVEAEYESTWVPDLAASTALGRNMGIEAKLAPVEVRILGGRDVPALLPEIHRVSGEIFKDNHAYSPIGLPEFLKLAGGGKGVESVLILTLVGGRTAGFGYGYAIGPWSPDPKQAPVASAVFKTLGVSPEFRRLGLGYGLTYLMHKYWLDHGVTGLIHAYMKTDNLSRELSGLVSAAFRRYALVKGKT